MATTLDNMQPVDKNATADGAQHSQDCQNGKVDHEHTPTLPTLPEDEDTDAVPTPPSFQGLNVGQLGGSQSQRAPLVIGIIAQAEFSFVAQNIIDLFVKKNRTTHISFIYLTDAYNKQSSLHLTTTMYKTQVDVATGESILIAQPLPDLNKRGMSFTDWTRAFQCFKAILIAIENPIAL
ncbi:hypothetical protein FRC06_003038 [Ceratobasidium sp. 370]|nr:hypothetical protein FRC06_003038 [Ceratobasidium sp. 370]